MSCDESTDGDTEPENAEGLSPLEDLSLEQRGSAARDLRSMSSQELSDFRALSQGHFSESALARTGMHTGTGTVENTLMQSNIRNAFLGNVTLVGSEKTTNINDSGSRRSEASDEIILKNGIRVFKSKRIYISSSGVLIFKGEKSKFGGVHKLAVKLIPYSTKAKREAESLEKLDGHKNIAKVHDSGNYGTEGLGGYVFIAMKLYSKETLFDYVTRNDNFDIQQAISHSTQIISGLEYIHKNNIAHRDLTPHNVLFFDDTGRNLIIITDFGVSKYGETEYCTTTNQAPGKNGYLSPELIKNQPPNDPRKCDIFSLGILLYFSLSNGKHPYGDEMWRCHINISLGAEPDLSKILVPDEYQKDAIQDIIKKALQNDPESRPTASEIKTAWQNAIKNSGSSFHPQMEPQEPRRITSRLKTMLKTLEDFTGPSHQFRQRRSFPQYAEDERPGTSGIRANFETLTIDPRRNERNDASGNQARRGKRVPELSEEEPSSKMEKFLDALVIRAQSPKWIADFGFQEFQDKAPEYISKLRAFIGECSRQGNETDVASGFQGEQRKNVRRTIHSPSIIGVTGKRRNHELIIWRSIEELDTDPMIILEMCELLEYNFTIFQCMHSLYLLAENKTCYELNLNDATKGLVKRDSMKHSHGDFPPADVLNGNLYVCGQLDYTFGKSVSKKCEVYSGGWSEIIDMNEARNGNRVVAYEGYLYSVGGEDIDKTPLRSVERYDPSTKQWKYVGSLNVARFYPQAVVYGGKLYVFGGLDPTRFRWINSFECFRPSDSSWELSTPAWWSTEKALIFPFVLDNKVLSLHWNFELLLRGIEQVPFTEEDRDNPLKIRLPKRWSLYSIMALQ